MDNIRTILWFIIAALFVVFIFVGFDEIKKKAKHKIEEENHNKWMNNRQEYVRANLDKFGCKNIGSSLDDKKIYLVDYDKMGY